MKNFVVVGASLAGLRAVEAARKDGFDGRITLIGGEEHLPYDRPPLSKQFLYEDDELDTTFRSRSYLRDDLGVDLRLGTWARGLDIREKRVQLDTGEIGYDALVVATGSRARTLSDYDHLDGVHTLRTVDDARAVRAALASAVHVVVVGAGFIGAEVASAARRRGLDVTIVEAAPVPLVRALGDEMGEACSALHVRNGVRLICGAHVQEIEGKRRVEAVRLGDGTRLPADLVVVGIGADPATAWLESSGIAVERGLTCDATLATSAEGVYGAGDIVSWHNRTFGQSMRLENWTSAAEQGRMAARNALGLGEPTAYATVPYYWTHWYGMSLQFVGLPTAEETQVVSGSVDSDKWVTVYRLNDRLVGALAVNSPSVIMKCRMMINNGVSWQEGLDFMAERRRASSGV